MSNPSNITAAHVSHAQYASMPCDEVQAEFQRVSAREADLSSRQKANYVTDTVLLTTGLVVFWPALLFMPATTDRKSEIAQMRGEKEALERAVGRQCSTRMARPTTAAPSLAGYAAEAGAAPLLEARAGLQSPDPIRHAAASTRGGDARGKLLVRVDLAPASSDSRAGRGLVVLDVLPGGVGSAAGLRPGDVILALDGASVGTVDDMQNRLRAVGTDKVVVATVRRDGQERPVALRF